MMLGKLSGRRMPTGHTSAKGWVLRQVDTVPSWGPKPNIVFQALR